MQLASVPRQRSNQRDNLVVGGTGCPGSRRGLPPGVTVFANARIKKQPDNPASHHECKNARHRDSEATPNTAER